jgi:hypothetical protein
MDKWIEYHKLNEAANKPDTKQKYQSVGIKRGGIPDIQVAKRWKK